MAVIDLGALAFPRAPVLDTPLAQPIPPGATTNVKAPIGYPIRPGDPGYAQRIPKGAPDPPPAVVEKVAELAEEAGLVLPATMNGSGGVVIAPQPAFRLVINYGRGEGMYSLAIEAAPSWDIEGKPKSVSESALKELYPILATLVKIKNMTEDEFEQA